MKNPRFWWRPTVPLNSEELKKHFDYNPDTGLLFRKTVKGPVLVGYPNTFGYLLVGFKGKKPLVHRIAWTISTGSEPEGEIDHVNGIKTDNRILNLRPANRNQNLFNKKAQSNSKSGIKGVSWDSKSRKWHAKISANGKHIHLGYFSNKYAAAKQYNSAAKSLHGEFCRKELNGS